MSGELEQMDGYRTFMSGNFTAPEEYGEFCGFQLELMKNRYWTGANLADAIEGMILERDGKV